MSMKVGSLTIEPSVVAKQLRGDMKDDWFFDPLNYVDMLKGSLLTEIIKNNFEKHAGLYQSSSRHLFNIPKPNFTLRYAMETSLSDRFLYHGLVAFLVPYFDELLGPSVYSHRYNYDKPDERYLFKRGVHAWGDFIGSVKSALTPGRFLVSTDLTNYYEGVSLPRLKDSLVSLIPRVIASVDEKSTIHNVIGDLFRYLDSWTFDQERGLPQNRDASSFLANIYMHRVDAAMQKLGYTGVYFRYMDDIKIICDNEWAARLALKRLIVELRKYGLSVNAKKTYLASESDKATINSCLQEGSPLVLYLDSVWRTNNTDLILGSTQELKSYTLQLLEEEKYDSREFRFCIKRLYNLCMCSAFSVPPQFFDEVTPAVIRGLGKAPAATDQISKYLRAAPLNLQHLQAVRDYLLDSSKAIYGWQNYQLWTLLTERQYADSSLLNTAMDVVASGVDNASRAGATLYLGALGKAKERQHIATHFPSVKSFFGQRIAVIAIHELQYDPFVRDFVAPTLREDLLGVYKNLKQSKGSYVYPLEPVLLGEDTFEEHES